MPFGRRDYVSGFLLETGTGARYTSSLYLDYITSCPAWSGCDIGTYTVPIGYRIALNTIICSSTSSMVSYFVLWLSGNSIMTVHFDTHLNLRFSDQNPLYFVAGNILKFKAYNNYGSVVSFYTEILGVLEQIIIT